MSENQRNKAVETAIKEIEKRFGKGAIMKLGDASKMTVGAISTGSIAIDLVTGIGGIPVGRIIEIYGP